MNYKYEILVCVSIRPRLCQHLAEALLAAVTPLTPSALHIWMEQFLPHLGVYLLILHFLLPPSGSR